MSTAPPISDRPPGAARPAPLRFGLADLAASIGVVAASTGVGFLIRSLLSGCSALPDVVMVFVLGVVVIATRFSFAAAILTALLSVLAYDVLFIPPIYSLTVDDARHVVTFVVMFVVAVVISSLTRRIREHADAAMAREERTRELYAERARIAREAEAARLEVEAERLRSSLLSSVSHDLRTPLAVITGAATTLLDDSAAMGPAARRDLLSAICDESVRLTRLVQNLLDMTRLAAGALSVKKQWESVEAVVGAALRRVEERVAGRPLRVDVPADSARPLQRRPRRAGPHQPAGERGEVLAPGLYHRGERVAGRPGRRRDRGEGPRPRRPRGGARARLREVLQVRRRSLGRRRARPRDLPRGGRGARRAHRGHGPGGRRLRVPLHAARRGHGARGAGGRGCDMSQDVKVLLIEDEDSVRRFLRPALAAQGYLVLEATTGAEGLALAASHDPELVLLDLGLPDLDGLTVTRRLREATRAPIIILSARGQELDKVQALDAGADDYLTKPFGLSELLARIRVARRHADAGERAPADGILVAGPVRVDLGKRRVSVGDREVRLTPIEYKLLVTLARSPGRVLTHQHLLKEVWGAGRVGQTQYLHVYMGHLRSKLEADPARPKLLLSEPGVGYRFEG